MDKTTTYKNNKGAPKGNKNALGNRGGPGASTKYKREFDTQAYKLCLLGATDKELADFFDVGVRTIDEWKKQHLSFLQSLKRGKIIADSTVAEKLYQRALGYSCPDVDIKVIKNKVVKTKLVKHYPPDSVAAIFWLKNRRKSEWRDRQNLEIDFNSLSDQELDLILDKITARANKS